MAGHRRPVDLESGCEVAHGSTGSIAIDQLLHLLRPKFAHGGIGLTTSATSGGDGHLLQAADPFRPICPVGVASQKLHREVFTFRWGLFSRLPPTFWRAGWRRCPCRPVAGFGCLLGGLLCARGGSGHAAACGASRVIVVRAWRWLPR
jgi:hypothetical protein